MQINVAHLRDQGISFAVFDADAPSRTKTDRDELLLKLTQRLRSHGLRVDKAALTFKQGRRLMFHGTPDLVRYLSGNPLALRWTHTLTV
jgi:hypothetical protein